MDFGNIYSSALLKPCGFHRVSFTLRSFLNKLILKLEGEFFVEFLRPIHYYYSHYF